MVQETLLQEGGATLSPLLPRPRSFSSGSSPRTVSLAGERPSSRHVSCQNHWRQGVWMIDYIQSRRLMQRLISTSRTATGCEPSSQRFPVLLNSEVPRLLPQSRWRGPRPHRGAGYGAGSWAFLDTSQSRQSLAKWTEAASVRRRSQ